MINSELRSSIHDKNNYITQVDRVLNNRVSDLSETVSLVCKPEKNYLALSLNYNHNTKQFYYFNGYSHEIPDLLLQKYNNETRKWDNKYKVCGTGIYIYPLVKHKIQWEESTPNIPGTYRFALMLGYPLVDKEDKFYTFHRLGIIDTIYSNEYTIAEH